MGHGDGDDEERDEEAACWSIKFGKGKAGRLVPSPRNAFGFSC